MPNPFLDDEAIYAAGGTLPPSIYDAAMGQSSPGIAQQIFGGIGRGARAIGGGIRDALLTIPDVGNAVQQAAYNKWIREEIEKAKAAGNQDRIDQLYAASRDPDVLDPARRTRGGGADSIETAIQKALIQDTFQRKREADIDAREVTQEAERNAREKAEAIETEKRDPNRQVAVLRAGIIARIAKGTATEKDYALLDQINKTDPIDARIAAAMRKRGIKGPSDPMAPDASGEQNSPGLMQRLGSLFSGGAAPSGTPQTRSRERYLPR